MFFPYSRPNPFNPTSKSGFGAEGLMNLIGMFTSIAPDFHYERKLTWICNDQIALLSRVTGTIQNIEGNFGTTPTIMEHQNKLDIFSKICLTGDATRQIDIVSRCFLK